MADQPPIDISPENWQIVRDILQRLVPDREVWAFGSRAKWTAKEYSDLDIAFMGDEPLSIGVVADLNEAFQESALPFKVDVVDWAAITPSFRKVVESSKVLLHDRLPADRGEGSFSG
jgi:type I restriction enzyme S subunit